MESVLIACKILHFQLVVEIITLNPTYVSLSLLIIYYILYLQKALIEFNQKSKGCLNDMFNQVAFGKTLKSIRKEKDFTQEWVAEKIGVSGQAVSKWEKGECLPDVYNLKLLGRLYCVSTDSLLEMSDDNNEKVGQIINFGGYQWMILKIDGNRALVITENVIFQSVYHDESVGITWENCRLRSYLNREFYYGFSECDRRRIIETTIPNPPNPWFGTSGGNDTTDNIFILSVDELVEYFGDSGDLASRKGWYWNDGDPILGDGEGILIKDQFDKNRTAYMLDNTSTQRDIGRAYWRLRTPGRSGNLVMIVYNGWIGLDGNDLCMVDGGIRPALWLRL